MFEKKVEDVPKDFLYHKMRDGMSLQFQNRAMYLLENNFP